MHKFLLGHLTVGIRQPPIIVAELSGNHNHSLERALTMVDKAADAGAQAIKRMSGIHLAIPVFSKGYRPKQGKVAP